MKNSIKSIFEKLAHAGSCMLHKNTFAFLLCVSTCISIAYADNDDRIFIQSTQKIKGFGGLAVKPSGELLLSAQPKNVRRFDPVSQQFEGNAYELADYSFSDDIALIPRDDSRGIIGGFALASFLDGRIPTVLRDGTEIQSNTGEFFVVPETGIYQATYNPELQGIDPITYRSSNDRLYAQAFDPTFIYKVDWRGSVPEPIALSVPTALNAFQFGPDDKLYAPDLGNNQIVKIDADSGDVTPVVANIEVPIALKVDSNGVLYFIGRRSGNVYKYNQVTDTLILLATVQPALDNLALNETLRKIYVTNDENKIFEVDMDTGENRILFQSPIVQPWDLAYDSESDSLYVADFGSLKQFNANNAALQRHLIIDSDSSGLGGSGQVSGVTVEQGTGAKIIMTDLTLGNIMVINKSDFSVYDVISTFETGLFQKQPYSTVRVTGGTPSEFYLTTNTVDGTIVKIYHSNSGLVTETFFSGLNAPVKLKLSNGYLYIVEAGQLVQGVPNTGRISRLPLSNPIPQARQILVDNLDNPQGLDIFNDKMVFVEVGSKKLLQASAISPCNPIVLQKKLKLSSDLIISQFNPIPIDPFVGVAVTNNGNKIFVNQTKPDNIIRFDNDDDDN